MNYSKGIFRIWLVIAAAIASITAFNAADDYSRDDRYEIYFTIVKGSGIYDYAYTCPDPKQRAVLTAIWQQENTRFSSYHCQTDQVIDLVDHPEFGKKMWENTNAVTQRIALDSKNRMDNALRSLGIGGFSLLVWLLILAITAFISRGFKDKS